MLRVCFNCYGNYTTDRVYQWDQNHKLHIVGLDLTYAPAVHFCNKKSSEAIVVQSEKVSDGFTAPIPNILLQEEYNIIAYVHIYDVNDENAKTVEIINIPLVKRVKPSEYQFEDNVEVMSFERLETDIADFIAKMEGEFEDYTSNTDAKYNAFTTESTNNYTNFTNKVVNDYEYLKDETQSATGVKSGKVVAIADSRATGLPKISLFGKSVQNTYSGKNLLKNMLTTYTKNGVTFTVNEDKTVTANGTPTAYTELYINNSVNLKAGTYILSGSGNTSSSITLVLVRSDGSLLYNSTSDATFTLDSDETVGVKIATQGVTFNNYVFKPMIRDASITDATYEPFVGGVASPNPSFPQAITSVADDKSLVVKSCGKNLLSLSEYTTNATGGTHKFMDIPPLKYGDTYILSGTTTEGKKLDGTIAQIVWLRSDNSVVYQSGLSAWTNGATVNANLEEATSFKIYTTSGIAGKDIQIQLEKGNTITTYEPHISTEASLTLADSLRGIPVASGGNYVDEDGQTWICDTIEKYVDGSGKLIKRIYRKVFDGTESLNPYSSSTVMFGAKDSNIPIVKNDNSFNHNTLCNKFTYDNDLWINGNSGFHLLDNSDYPIRFRIAGITTVEDTKAQLKAWYDAGEPMELIYELAEYVETDLTADQVAELEKLQTFEPCTTIYTDDIGDIVVAYFKNNFNGEFMDEHIHDDRYYRKDKVYKKSETYSRTEVEMVAEICDGKLKEIIDEDLANKSNIDHTHKQLQVNGLRNNDKYYLDITPTGEVSVSYYNSEEDNTSTLWSSTYHNHDDRYYTHSQVQGLINGHNHDTMYYRQTEVNTMFKDFMVTQTFESTNSDTWHELDVSKSGYTPIAIVDIQTSFHTCYTYTYQIFENKAQFNLNEAGTLKFKVLYIKTY